MSNTNGDLNIEIGAELRKVESALRQVRDRFQQSGQEIEQTSSNSSKKVESTWSKGLNRIGGYIAGAFAVSAIQRFASEAIELAGKAEGIEAAFRRLDNPNLLSDLRRATRGTITDLELMRQAVRAQNFQIPLEKLATFFEFATKRSAQTGESVDYLVNSIIDGIGRKSTLVLDNLGISAARLQEEVKKVGDFGLAAGNIIQEEIGKAGDVALTSAQKIAQQTAALENQKAVLGQQLVPGYISLLDTLNDIVRTFSSMDGLMSGMASAGLGRGFMMFEGISDSAQENRMRKMNVEFDKMVMNMKRLVAMQDATKDGASWMDEYWKGKNKMAEVNTTLEEYTKLAEKAIQLNQGLIGVNNGRIQGPGNALANISKEDIQGVTDFVERDLENIENLDKEAQAFWENQRQQMELASGASLMFGSSLAMAFEQGMESGMSFADSLGQMLEQMVKRLLAAAAAAAVLAAVLAASGLGGFGLAKGASFSQLFKGGFLSLGGFGNGGLQQSNLAGVGTAVNRNVSVNVVGRVKGSDLVFAMDRSEINRNRQRGF